ASMALLQRLNLTSPALRNGMIAVLSVAALLTFQRSDVWADDIGFWQDVLKKDPGNSRAHLGLAGSYLLHGQPTDALAQYDAIDKIDGVKEATILNRVAAYQFM